MEDGTQKLKFTRIEKNGQCLNECMELCLQNNYNADFVLISVFNELC